MRLIANRQLCHGQEPDGRPAIREANGEFEEADLVVANHLLRTGVARRAGSPTVLYETKVIVPEASVIAPEVSARPAFRDLPVSDEKSPELASESNPELPSADIPEPGTADPGGRGEHQGSGSRKRNRKDRSH